VLKPWKLWRRDVTGKRRCDAGGGFSGEVVAGGILLGMVGF